VIDFYYILEFIMALASHSMREIFGTIPQGLIKFALFGISVGVSKCQKIKYC